MSAHRLLRRSRSRKLIERRRRQAGDAVVLLVISRDPYRLRWPQPNYDTRQPPSSPPPIDS